MTLRLTLVGDLVPPDLANRIARHFDGLTVTPDRASQIALFVTAALDLPTQGAVLIGDPDALRSAAPLLGEEVKIEAVPHPGTSGKREPWVPFSERCARGPSGRSGGGASTENSGRGYRPTAPRGRGCSHPHP